MDAIKNFVKVNVSTGYDASATTVVLAAGEGAKLPDPATANYNLVWFNNKDYGDPADDPNVSIVRVTGKSTDTLTVIQPAVGNSYNGETSSNTAKDHNAAGKTWQMILAPTYKIFKDIADSIATIPVKASSAEVLVGTDDAKFSTPLSLYAALRGNSTNILRNGNFINNSTNGYGGTPDNWTASNANAVQGGFPEMTKQQLIDLLGVADGDIEGLWNLNEASGNALDLSSNGYNLAENGGTIDASSDGLMALARDFELGDTECFTIANANCENLNITGSQTWFAFVKPESISANHMIMSKWGSGSERQFYITADGYIASNLAGLSTTSSLQSDVKLEAGKWYLIVLIYDSANSLYKLWVNGVKKQRTATGAISQNTNAFDIGSYNNNAGFNFDGLIQCAGILSTALSDDQVKRFFYATLYKGIKLRRATNDAVFFQDSDYAMVSPSLPIELRGKPVTISAKMWQTVANTGGLLIGYTGTTIISDNIATIGEWVDISLTVTPSATTRYISFGTVVDTSDGTVWFKDVRVNYGSVSLPFTHSPNDLERFPRLLRMDFPAMFAGKAYQYEENRWYATTPIIDTTDMDNGTGATQPTIGQSRWGYVGKRAFGQLEFTNAVKNGATDYIKVTSGLFIKVGSIPAVNSGLGLVTSDLTGAKSGAAVFSYSTGFIYYIYNANIADNATLTNIAAEFNYEID